MPKRRKFSPEFKKGAVEQARQPNVSCAQVARELGHILAACGHEHLFPSFQRESATYCRLYFGPTHQKLQSFSCG